ncbi:M23 family metallopeptidase [Lysobacter pythonis]|uniref:M23 family metallopeptidase n=1 Tax=Solilutibacter pythonis TaxID=2483112 RepID=A0A3M2I4N1_9GAMM|nr:M23 family metallopeptidase [Lysobacter pythonis]RMH94192.1 M23 family metallopeptidase [Lysobacter pythonis]
MRSKLQRLAQHTRARAETAARRLRGLIHHRPLLAGAVCLALGVSGGVGAMRVLAGPAGNQATALSRDAAQRELNAMAARLAELQAETTRLNALGQRLAREAELPESEFDFGQPVGIGGGGTVHDIAPATLLGGIGQLDAGLRASGNQLTALESLLFNRRRDRAGLPSGQPIAGSYVTSGFGLRADPFGGGGQFHKGIDYKGNHGDPVLAVAEGVVTFAGERNGYGHTIEVDHGNGYVTRYAHNSRLSRQVGDLVRMGDEVAKAGSSGRSTGVHVHLEVWRDGRYVDPSRFLGRTHD